MISVQRIWFINCVAWPSHARYQNAAADTLFGALQCLFGSVEKRCDDTIIVIFLYFWTSIVSVERHYSTETHTHFFYVIFVDAHRLVMNRRQNDLSVCGTFSHFVYTKLCHLSKFSSFVMVCCAEIGGSGTLFHIYSSFMLSVFQTGLPYLYCVQIIAPCCIICLLFAVHYNVVSLEVHSSLAKSTWRRSNWMKTFVGPFLWNTHAHRL